MTVCMGVSPDQAISWSGKRNKRFAIWTNIIDGAIYRCTKEDTVRSFFWYLLCSCWPAWYFRKGSHLTVCMGVSSHQAISWSGKRNKRLAIWTKIMDGTVAQKKTLYEYDRPFDACYVHVCELEIVKIPTWLTDWVHGGFSWTSHSRIREEKQKVYYLDQNHGWNTVAQKKTLSDRPFHVWHAHVVRLDIVKVHTWLCAWGILMIKPLEDQERECACYLDLNYMDGTLVMTMLIMLLLMMIPLLAERIMIHVHTWESLLHADLSSKPFQDQWYEKSLEHYLDQDGEEQLSMLAHAIFYMLTSGDFSWFNTICDHTQRPEEKAGYIWTTKTIRTYGWNDMDLCLTLPYSKSHGLTQKSLSCGSQAMHGKESRSWPSCIGRTLIHAFKRADREGWG